MLNFDAYINLPMVWGGLIVLAVLLYILLDGFDLGIGILFPFAPSDQCRDRMMHSIAPFWDGNETWLVLGGGGLFAAFPLAYAILMPAFYIPVLIMLIALIFRGVAFEFRFKAASNRDRKIWDHAFHFGSLLAAFAQGVILGGIVQGVKVEGRSFAGHPFDWLTEFSVFTGVAVIFGYALLGACWLIIKADGKTQDWARQCASYVLIYVVAFMVLVSLWMPYHEPYIKERWFSLPNFYYLLPVPLSAAFVVLCLIKSINQGKEYLPFIYAVLLFFLSYAGLIISIWPWVVPFGVSLEDAAAAAESLSLLLIGAVLTLPIVLAYTAYSYYVFRGKTSSDGGY